MRPRQISRHIDQFVKGELLELVLRMARSSCHDLLDKFFENEVELARFKVTHGFFVAECTPW